MEIELSPDKSNTHPSRITPHDQAVLQLKGQRDQLRQYTRRNEASIDRERQMARKLIAEGKKDRALLLLKKKRFQDQMIDRALKRLEAIERMVHDLEFADIEQRVIEGLKQGNESLRTMHRLLSVEDVEKIMDETRDAVEYQREIDALLAGQLSDEDIVDVEEELAVLLNEQLMPDVPVDDVQMAEDDSIATADQKTKAKKQKRELIPIAAS